jgi:putative SOS response-associated peptidase YedK
MSYRLVLHADVHELTDRFHVTQVLAFHERNSEIAPTGLIPAIFGKQSERLLDECRWGLMPYWAKASVQADTRSVLTNKSFDYMLKRQRCIIPCSSYYSVTPGQRGRKQEHRLLHKGRLLAIAGVYDLYKNPYGEELRTCTILSVPARSAGQDGPVPMLLSPAQMDAWLSTEFLAKGDLVEMVEDIAAIQPETAGRSPETPASREAEEEPAGYPVQSVL